MQPPGRHQHARKAESRLAAEPEADAVAELRAEDQRLRQEIAGLRRDAEGLIRRDKAARRRRATTAFAMGVSLRQVEDLLGVLLPANAVPDHSTSGHRVQAEARRAGAVLKALDPMCAPHVRTLALDGIFFGGDRPWSRSSRRA